jgi:hypothetical protein
MGVTMNNMTSQQTFTDSNQINYELFVGNNARAAIVVKDLDSGHLVACIGGEEGTIRRKYKRTIDTVIAIEMGTKAKVVIQ